MNFLKDGPISYMLPAVRSILRIMVGCGKKRSRGAQ